jgi:CHAT domain/MalT-like TPR region
MGRRRIRDVLPPLLILLLASGSAAAATSAERAFHDARLTFQHGDAEAAQKQIDDALRRFGNSDDDAVWALRVLRAEVLTTRRQYPDAAQAFAVELPQRLRHSVTAVRRLAALVGYSIHRHDAAAERRYFDEGVTLAKRYQPSVLHEVLFFGQYVYPDQADALLRQTYTLARQHHDDYGELRALHSILNRRLHAGRWVEAIHAFERELLPRLRESHYDFLLQKAEGDLGWALRELGDDESASEYFTRAERAAARANAVFDQVPWLNQLGNLAFDRHDFSTAEQRYRQAYELANPIQHRDLKYITANLASVALETGHYDDARRFNAEAIALKKQQNDAEAIAHSQLIDARIAVATQHYDDALRTLQQVDAKTPSTRWETDALLATIFARQKRINDADEKYRQMIATVREARESIDDEELRLAFFRTARDVIDDDLDFLYGNGRMSEALRVKEQLNGQDLEETLGMSSQHRDPRDVAREIGATILCYHLGGEHSYVWTVTPDAIAMKQLPPRAVIESAVDAYLRDLLGARGTLAMSGARGAQLWHMLVEPAGVTGGRVVVIADGRLHALNMETLVVPSPRRHYWIEDVVLRSAPSIELLARESAPHARGGRMLLVGNAPQADPAYPALPRAGLEIERVRQRFANAVVLTGAKATPRAYRDAAPQSFDILHFVAHGEATRMHPLDSSVILARDRDGYKLAARDIIKQPLHARLVTISSCYGAGTRTYAGEGLVGLAWAFLRANAQQVIAAVWDVSDRATPDLMDSLYAAIRRGADPDAALREAKLKLVRSGNVYSKPLYWAPFVLYSRL